MNDRKSSNGKGFLQTFRFIVRRRKKLIFFFLLLKTMNAILYGHFFHVWVDLKLKIYWIVPIKTSRLLLFVTYVFVYHFELMRYNSSILNNFEKVNGRNKSFNRIEIDWRHVYLLSHAYKKKAATITSTSEIQISKKVMARKQTWQWDFRISCWECSATTTTTAATTAQICLSKWSDLFYSFIFEHT